MVQDLDFVGCAILNGGEVFDDRHSYTLLLFIGVPFDGGNDFTNDRGRVGIGGVEQYANNNDGAKDK